MSEPNCFPAFMVDLGKNAFKLRIVNKKYPFSIPDVENPEELGKELGILLKDFQSMPNFAMMPFATSPSSILADTILNYIKNGSVETPQHDIFSTPFSSATNALFTILNLINVTGREVITTSLNYPGVINAIILAGGIPRLIDIEKETFGMDVQKIKPALRKNTACIIVSHLNNLVDVDAIYDEVGSEIPIIEDSALAFASRKDGMLPGTSPVSFACLFSFLSTKILCGYGSAVVTSPEEDLILKIKEFSYQGLDLVNPSKIVQYGANFKPNEISSYIALKQMDNLMGIIDWRTKLAMCYDESIKSLEDLNIRAQKINEETIVTHYAISLPMKDKLALNLYSKHNITLATWPCAHKQIIYKSRFGKINLPITDEIADSFVFLPFFKGMTREDTDYICSKIKWEIKNG